MRDRFIETLTALVQENPKIMLITGDLGFGVLTKFALEYSDNYLNAGVAEQNMTGLATGLAMDGRIVFTYSIANFPILRCLEQIRNDAAYHEANVKVVSIGGGFSYGSLGMSHHATEDLSVMRALPGVTVVSPGCLWEVREATKAIVNTPGVCYLRLDKSSAGDTQKENETFELGKIRRLREGEDVTLITTGGILDWVLKAADQLSSEGVRCRVLSVHTIKPIDRAEIISACTETGGIVTIEENVLSGGLGSAVAEVCLDEGCPPKKFKRIGLKDIFSSVVGDQYYLRGIYGMDEPAILAAAREIVGSAR